MCNVGRVTTPDTTPRRVDYSALTATTTRAEVAAFKTAHKAGGGSWGRLANGALVGTIFGAIAVGVFLVVMANTFLRLSAEAVRTGEVNLVGIAFGSFFVIIAIAIVIVVVRGIGIGTWTKWMRLSRFADANNLVFSPRDSNPSYPGSIFSRGHSRFALDHLRAKSGRFLDYGNYRYVTGSGKNQTTHNWGFLAFQLDRRLPHMVLDSTANNGLFGGSNLGVTFTKDQRLSLEGDFDRYFTLYCPREYERDALYVFTPDLMALLIDEAAPFDVEIVDSWMFVYSAKPLAMVDPAVHERLLRIVDTVGTKTLTQTERYADERVGDRTANIVAPPGRRLKTGVSITTIIVVGFFIVYWGFSFFGGMFGFVGN